MSYLKRKLAERLQDPEFKKAWEESEVEYLIARNIINFRKKRGLTQKQLAVALGTQQSVVSRIENGEHNLSIESIKSIAHVLGTDVATIVSKPQKDPRRAHYKLVKTH